MPFRETKDDHARIFSDGFLRVKALYDPNAEYSILEIEEDAKRIARFLAANTSACFIRMFKAELDELDIQKPIQGLLENNPKEEEKKCST
jgi:hypothetical protein